jgi:hypothetical protein
MFVLEEKPEENISYFQKDGPRTGLGILGAALTLCAMATGYHSALALVSTAWILTGMTAMVGPSMSIRGYICLSSLFQVRVSPRRCFDTPDKHAGHTSSRLCHLGHLPVLLALGYR